MASLDAVIGVALGGLQGRGDQLVQDPRIAGARSVVTSAGTVPAQRLGEEPAGRRQVAALGQQDVDDLAALADGPV
ncbi:MAG TPA: hypothetical protein VHZ03_25950 [Trebonia sp.]|jgi:hypothetical protein|nr:hypothetical protein [Trebonia sp.]